MSWARKCKRNKYGPSFQYYDSEDKDDSGVRDEIHCHTEYISQSRKVSTRTSYYTTVDPLPSEDVDSQSVEFYDQPELPIFGHAKNPEELFPDGLKEEYQHYLTGLGYDIPSGHHKRTAGVGEIDSFLAELLCLEGHSEFKAELCPGCFTNIVMYRCSDCQDLQLYCQGCTLEIHTRNPFHHISHWAANHFKCISLKSLVYRLQLEHPVSKKCVNPIRTFGDQFVVINISGIHEIGLNFCGCGKAVACQIQLLQARLYPAATADLKIATTFRVLKHYHLLSCQLKTSAMHFWNTLCHCTDNTGIDRYPTFLHIMCQWRHLKLLKRVGRGHDETSMKGTALGECAVSCPVCPHPGKNLPDDWRDAPPERRYLYRLFVAIDANFHLKRKKMLSDKADPGLNHGYVYFVKKQEYKAHLEKLGDIISAKSSSCSNYNTIKFANLCGVNGVAASGVGTVDCSRYDMKWPGSVGDLQKGEQYINMDYIFLSSMDQNVPDNIILSYDTACQFEKNLLGRRLIYGTIFSFFAVILWLIPKFYFPAHQDSCHFTYSFNLNKEVGRTDGKAPERGWADANGMATSTKEMRPGSCCDTLDDIFGDYNWRKITSLGELLKKLKTAVEKRDEQMAAFQEFNNALPAEQMSNRAQAWHETISPSNMIESGLQLEETQYCFHADVLSQGIHTTDLQQSKILDRRSALHCKIDCWIEVQQSYVCSISGLHMRMIEEQSNTILMEDIPLLLPSQLADRYPCEPALLKIEWRLQEGQAYDALDDLHHHLCLQSHIFKFNDKFVRDMVYNTPAHAALLSMSLLLSKQGWQTSICPLKATDIQKMRVYGVGNGTEKNEGVQEALRVKWCTAHARAHHWTEECCLLLEEMQRIMQFHRWQAQWWSDKADDPHYAASPEHAEGLRAYVYRQANIRESMHSFCARTWSDVPQYMTFGQGSSDATSS
ncbi:hypothetical protein OBBRIDRAFT_815395 [Obba rivulosa]|uniref:CxC2-like cysteine cluster KDZ transposase-associated domain-containing protein n=1 Tax=Obba rivulosa TaxID=1052685 RepID=A0A8E2AQ30_9APHY|nr:hypothetical protein OBBRIDRAFT_815395 [Obba rivulosa]